MLSTFNRNKAKLTVAAMAAGLGLHLASFAQAANDSGTWVETRTGGNGSPINETTWAHMAGDSCVGRWRGWRSRPKERAGNPRRDHLSGLSVEPASLAAHGRAQPPEWPGLRPEHGLRQPLVERGHCPGGARKPRACPQRTRPPKADDAQLPLSPHRPGVVVRVWVFV